MRVSRAERQVGGWEEVKGRTGREEENEEEEEEECHPPPALNTRTVPPCDAAAGWARRWVLASGRAPRRVSEGFVLHFSFGRGGAGSGVSPGERASLWGLTGQ